MQRDKGDAFRIFALGELQTFGPTLRDGERPWPELLQDLFDQHAECGRRVEVVNAGTEAYTLEDNLERMRRDILPLKPDLILSAHGMNGLLALGLRRVPEPNEPGVRPRASALIGRAVLTIERAAHDWRSRNSAEARAGGARRRSPDAELMKSRYAEAYRKLIALARDRRRRTSRSRTRAWRSTRTVRARSRTSTARCSSRSTTSSPPTPPTIAWSGS